jgi:hypothetical protein
LEASAASSEEASSSAFLTSVRSEGALPTTKAAAADPSADPSAAPSADPSADPSAPPSSARPDLRKPPKKDDWVDRESPQYIAGVLLGRMAKIEAMGYPEVIQAAMEHAAAHPPVEEEEAAAVVALMRHGPRPRSPMGLSFALEEALANDDAAAIEQASTAIAKYERAVAEKAAAEKAAAEKAAAQQAAKEKAEAERAKLEKARANAPLSKAERMRLAEKAAAENAAAEKAAAENGAAAAPAPAPALALATEPDVMVYTAHVTMALPPPPPPPAPVNEFILSDDFLCAKMERLALPDDGFHHREVAVPTVRLVWRRLRTHGRPPPARCAHAMCVSGAVAGISARLLVHGGVGYEALSDEVRLLRLPVDDRTRARIVLSDLHLLEPSTGTWSQPELCGWPATKRAFHCMHSLDGRILVLGGRDGDGSGRAVPDTALLTLTGCTAAGGDGFWTHCGLPCGLPLDLGLDLGLEHAERRPERLPPLVATPMPMQLTHETTMRDGAAPMGAVPPTRHAPVTALGSPGLLGLSRSHAAAAVVEGCLLLFGGLDAAEIGSPTAEMLEIDSFACALLGVTPQAVSVGGGTPLRLHGRHFVPTERASAAVRFAWPDAAQMHSGGGASSRWDEVVYDGPRARGGIRCARGRLPEARWHDR